MNRRGFVKLLAATAAIPVVSGADFGTGPGSAVTARASELVLPAGTLVTEASEIQTFTARMTEPSSSGYMVDMMGFDARASYRWQVRQEIEAEEYERITVLVNVEPIVNYHVPTLSWDVAAAYQVAGPLFHRYVGVRMTDGFYPRSYGMGIAHYGRDEQIAALASAPHDGLALTIARKLGKQVERDVLSELTKLRR